MVSPCSSPPESRGELERLQVYAQSQVAISKELLECVRNVEAMVSQLQTDLQKVFLSSDIAPPKKVSFKAVQPDTLSPQVSSEEVKPKTVHLDDVPTTLNHAFWMSTPSMHDLPSAHDSAGGHSSFKPMEPVSSSTQPLHNDNVLQSWRAGRSGVPPFQAIALATGDVELPLGDDSEYDNNRGQASQDFNLIGGDPDEGYAIGHESVDDDYDDLIDDCSENEDLWAGMRAKSSNALNSGGVMSQAMGAFLSIATNGSNKTTGSKSKVSGSFSVTFSHGNSCGDLLSAPSTKSVAVEESMLPQGRGFKLSSKWAKAREKFKSEHAKDKDTYSSDGASNPGSFFWVKNAGNTSARLDDFSFRIRGLQAFIVNPWSAKRDAWNFIGTLLIAYDVIIVPLQVFDMNDVPFTVGMTWISTLFFTADIGISFLTAYDDSEDHCVEYNPKKVMLHYLRTWFFLDLVAVLPDWIGIAIGNKEDKFTGMSRTVKFLRLSRSLRLLRLVKLQSFLRSLEKRFNNDFLICYFNVLKLMICVAVLAHYLACGWYGMSVLAPERGWAEQAKFVDSDSGHLYLTSLHWGLTQLQGTMEVSPVTTIERGYAVVVLYLGMIVAAAFISSLTNSMTRIHQIFLEKQSHRILLLRYLDDYHISGELSARVKNFIDLAVEEERTKAGEVELLQILPESLRMDLELESKCVSFTLHPLLESLANRDNEFARHLARAVSYISLAKNQVIFQRDAVCNRMYMISSGKLSYSQNDRGRMITRSGSILETLGVTARSTVSVPKRNSRFRQTEMLKEQNSFGALPSGTSNSSVLTRDTSINTVTVLPGSVLCEMALWTPWFHTGTCTVDVRSEIYDVKVSLFEDAVLQHSESGIRVLRYACQFIRWINGPELETLDDLSSPLDNDDEEALAIGPRRTSSRKRGRWNLFGRRSPW